MVFFPKKNFTTPRNMFKCKCYNLWKFYTKTVNISIPVWTQIEMLITDAVIRTAIWLAEQHNCWSLKAMGNITVHTSILLMSLLSISPIPLWNATVVLQLGIFKFKILEQWIIVVVIDRLQWSNISSVIFTFAHSNDLV